MPGHREPRVCLRVSAVLLYFIVDKPSLKKAMFGKKAVNSSL